VAIRRACRHPCRAGAIPHLCDDWYGMCRSAHGPFQRAITDCIRGVNHDACFWRFRLADSSLLWDGRWGMFDTPADGCPIAFLACSDHRRLALESFFMNASILLSFVMLLLGHLCPSCPREHPGEQQGDGYTGSPMT